jgi:WD40 repeat protein
VIPGYEILSELGRGGMGVVYQARQVRLDRPCAIKMILAGTYATLEAVARFLAEARAIARLQHPHIVQIHHIGEADGLPFFELEYLPGGGLDRQLDGTPWPPRRAARLVEQLAGAMAEAHRLGVVHRDLKPANVLLAADGTPKITDFGLAKMVGSESGLTRTELVMGSPSYMAPEQAEGHAQQAGPAADLYALGAILYELLTGRPPFRGATALETLGQVKGSEPVPPSRLVPGLPRDVETICLRCLRKEPGRRYKAASALAEDLRRFQAGEPIVARRTSGAERAWRWCRRQPALAAASGLALAAVALAIGLAIRSAWAREQARRAIQLQWVRSETLAASLALDRGLALCNQGEIALGLLWMTRALEMTPPGAPELDRAIRRNLAGWRPEVVPLVGRFRHRARVRCVAFSPDGSRLAIAGDDGDVQVRDARTLRLVFAPLHHESGVDRLAFAADGRTLFTSSSDHRAHAWDLAKGRPARPPTRLPSDASAVACKRDGEALVTATEAGQVRLVDPRTATPLGPPLSHPRRIAAAAFLPDDATLMIASGTVVRFWDPIGGTQVRPELEHPYYVESAAISPDGATVASSSQDKVFLWEAARGTPVGEPLKQPRWVLCVAFDPEGRILVAGCDDGEVLLWDLASRRRLASVPDHLDQVRGLAFRPGGRALLTASHDGHARLWDLAGLGPPAAPLLKSVDPIRLELGPDGRSLLVSDTRNQAALWAIDAGSGPAHGVRAGRRQGLEAPADDPAAARGIYLVAFRPDGRAFATAGMDPVVRYAETAGTGSVVRLWQMDSGRCVGKPLRFATLVRGLAFLPDGVLVIASDDHTARTWDPARGVPLGSPLRHDAAVTAVAVSPDGRLIATGSADRSARLWDARSGRPFGRRLAHQGSVTSVAFRPDGGALLTASLDHAARQWDLATGQPLGAPLRHRSCDPQAGYSPDGQLIATGSSDGYAQFWDAATGKPVGPSLRHDLFTGFASFHPGGRLLLTSGWDFTVRVWDVPGTAAGDVGRLVLWSQVVTGMELGADGSARDLDDRAWKERRERLGRMGGPPP